MLWCCFSYLSIVGCVLLNTSSHLVLLSILCDLMLVLCFPFFMFMHLHCCISVDDEHMDVMMEPRQKMEGLTRVYLGLEILAEPKKR